MTQPPSDQSDARFGPHEWHYAQADEPAAVALLAELVEARRLNQTPSHRRGETERQKWAYEAAEELLSVALDETQRDTDICRCGHRRRDHSYAESTSECRRAGCDCRTYDASPRNQQRTED